MNKDQEQKPANPVIKLEEEVLEFWDRAKIFEKSVEKEAPKGDYVFYDGPPFATGLPHHGHIVASLMKDAVPRYWTMNGYRVERKWGWDCHGLPIENIAEKELGFKRKKDILDYGIDKFNEFCRSKVLSYVEDWKVVIRRLGRWADMENSYKTMDLPFMESVWWVFKQLWDRGLIYESYRSIHICPRCETTLSQQEVTEGYKEGIKDLSAVVKFELVDEPGTYVLAWTTTPWTLVANTALAVNPKEDYTKFTVHKSNDSRFKVGETYITMGGDVRRRLFGVLAWHEGQDLSGLADWSASDVKGVTVKNVNELIKGSSLVGKRYKPLFDYFSKDENLKNIDKGWKIYAGDFVSTEEGTGIVHIAPAFGEDDLNLGKKENLPFVQHLGMDGVIHDEVTDFAGLHVKPIEDVQATDKKIVEWLDKNNKLFSSEQYEHNYPHCWRCETPLLNYVTTSWFVNVLKVKARAIELSKDINWSPAHIKEGRWGRWLEGARDWSISRQRFWASVMPIWKCEQCGEMKVFGSVADLEKASGKKITDIHKHIVDEIVVPCEKCKGEMRRVSDVLDTWFDSGSMPYAQMHYPFENKEKFEANFPAEFIAEGSDQTRAWFYYLHLLACAIKDKPAFKNVIVNGIVLAEDGKKMSKRLKNYTDPSELLERYGADAMRYYLLSSAVMMAEDLNFSDKGVEEALRKNLMVLWNVYKFYEMYSAEGAVKGSRPKVQSDNVLDRWILAELNALIITVTEQMEIYDLPRSVRPISDFINDFSTWYLRRSRDRFKSEDLKDKATALATTQYVFIELSKVMAPFMPFMAESLWQRATGNNFQDENQSVHLEAWPHSKDEYNFEDVLIYMSKAKGLTEAILAARDQLGIKVRQPLEEVTTVINLPDEYRKIVEDECNILKITSNSEEHFPKTDNWKYFGDTLGINVELSEELKLDGARRELVRSINNLRKNAGLTVADHIGLYYWTNDKADFSAPFAEQVFEKFSQEIMKDTVSASIIHEHKEEVDLKKEVKVNSETIWLGIKKEKSGGWLKKLFSLFKG